MDQVTLTIENHVATVVIDRQHVLNAVDGTAHARLNEIWDQLEADPDVRAVVITGAGTRAFCVGADMSASAVDKTGLEYWAGLDPNGFGGLSLRTTLDIPVIARVNGYALGGGMEIVLGADIVVAADTASFGLDGTARRAFGARRRHPPAGAPGPVHPGDGHAPDRPEGRGRRDAVHGPGQRGGPRG